MKELIKFSAAWCGPCKMLSKVMEGADLGISVKEVDIDEQFEVAATYQIRGVPTLVLLEDGKEVKRKTGMMQLKELKEFIE